MMMPISNGDTIRALSNSAELGLIEELDALLEQIHRREAPCVENQTTPPLVSKFTTMALNGVACAALAHGTKLAPLKKHLPLVLAARKDVHILHKRHILRCLKNIGCDPAEIASLVKEVEIDPKGIVVVDVGWPKQAPSKSGFNILLTNSRNRKCHICSWRISDF